MPLTEDRIAIRIMKGIEDSTEIHRIQAFHTPDVKDEVAIDKIVEAIKVLLIKVLETD